MNASKKQLWWISLALFAALGMSSIPVRAGDHWLSRNTETKPAPRAFYSKSDVVKTAADSAVTFDIVVSLYTNRTTVAERAPYEAIINYFAQALYEESNGAHKLGTVSIYSKRRHATSCDILWEALGHPCGSAAGYGTTGKHIFMFDDFKDGCGSNCNYNLLTHTDGAGYTLGHEWGHYCYGVYDEYRGDAASRLANNTIFPWDTDTPATNAVMDSQWNAVGGHYAWLNFSTALNDTHNTAQNRGYGASCWEVLARAASADPRTGARLNLPVRTFWPYLATFAPGSNEWPSIELPAGIADATNALKIVWMTDNMAMQIIIDHSGSMDPSYYDPPQDKIGYANSAARALVDSVPLPTSNTSTTSVGIIEFNGYPWVAQPLTPIVTQADKDTIKAAISATPSDGTDIGAAAQLGLDGLLAYTGSSSNSGMIAFLLTDGQDGGYSIPSAVANYQAAKVPLFTFGFGTDADGSTLGGMASDTGGKYYYSPVSQAAIQRAFLDANKVATDKQGLVSGSPSVAPGATVQNTFFVDSTVDTLTLVVTHDGATNAFDIVLVEPNGTTTHAPASCDNSAGTTTLCSFNIPSPVSGTWTLRSTSHLGAQANLSFDVQAVPKSVGTYSLSLASLGGADVQYPQPIALIASLSSSLPIAGAHVSAFVILPDGSTQTVAFADNGVPPDAVANDGVYSALYNPTQNGTYQFTVAADNGAGTARLTYTGTQPSATTLGTKPPVIADQPITENFQRLASLQVQVGGVLADDHGNSAGSATMLPTTNTNIAGRIDYSGDVDFFRVDVPDGMDSVIIRVSNLGSGIQPLLTIYDSDGTTSLGHGDLSDAASPAGYVVLQVTGFGGSTFYAAVSSTTTNGSYEISTGQAVASDAAAQAFDICLQDDKTHSVLQIDSVTGNYKFTSCTDAFTLSGTGIISVKKTVLKLTDKKTDRKLTASLDQNKHKGTMSLSAVIQTTPKKKSKTYKIKDKITTDNTCACP